MKVYILVCSLSLSAIKAALPRWISLFFLSLFPVGVFCVVVFRSTFDVISLLFSLSSFLSLFLSASTLVSLMYIISFFLSTNNNNNNNNNT